MPATHWKNWMQNSEQLATSTGIVSPCPRCCGKSRCPIWQPAIDVSTGFSHVSYWLLPAPAAASTCLMPVWGRRQNPDPGFHQYSAGLLQLAVLRHSRWSDEPPAVSSECCHTSPHRSQEVRSHRVNPTSAALAATARAPTSGFQDKISTLVYRLLAGCVPSWRLYAGYCRCSAILCGLLTIEHAWSRDHAISSATAVLPPPSQHCETLCLNSFGNRTSPSDNSNNR